MKKNIPVFLLLLLLVLTNPALVSAPENDHLLISEFVVTPTEGEFIEIFNPTQLTIDLSNYYLTDATHVSGGKYYYNIVTGKNYGGGSYSDFHARFPENAKIEPGCYQTVALNGDSAFFAVYGVYPTYEMAEDGAAGYDAPDLREAMPGSIQGLTSGLTNSDEIIILYYWDGESDLVQDVDYVLYDDGGQVPDEAIDKTGLKIDGPDADSDSSLYLNDTPIENQKVVVSPKRNFSAQRINNGEGFENRTGGNGITGHDETSEDLNATWAEAKPTPNDAFRRAEVFIADTSIYAGVSFAVPINISNVTGFEIYSFKLTLVFDQHVLDATGFTTDSSLIENWKAPLIEDSLGMLKISCADSTALSGAGVLMYIKFDAVGDAGTQTTLTFSQIIFNDGEPWVDATGGNITLLEKIDTVKVSLPDTTGKSGASIAIPLMVDDLTNLNITSYRAEIAFDQQVLDASGIEIEGALSEIWETPTIRDSVGKLIISATGADSLSGAGILLYINFDIVGDNASKTDLLVANMLFNSGKPVAQVSNGSFTVSGVVAVEEKDNNLSTANRFFLKQNYPNPFNPTTTIFYELARHSRVQMKIYSIMGQEVKSLIDQVQNAGSHSIEWDGRTNRGDLATSAIYVLEMKAGDFCQVRKMMLLR